MNWRARNAVEIPGASTSPLIKSAPIGGLLSDVVELTGMALPVQPPLESHPNTPSAKQTDTFVLQMTYDPAAISANFGDEATAAANGFVYLGWLNADYDGDPNATINDRWMNAVSGNFYADLNALFPSVSHFAATSGFVGSYADYFDGEISKATSSGLKEADSFQLGDWGVDPQQHTVWAVLNHNSEFAVVQNLRRPFWLSLVWQPAGFGADDKGRSGLRPDDVRLDVRLHAGWCGKSHSRVASVRPQA